MDFSHYHQFKSEVQKNVLKTFKNLINDSEAAEQAAVTKHLYRSGALESEKERPFIEDECLPSHSSNLTVFRLRMPSTFEKRSLIKYAILSWFLPEMTSWEVRETIRARAHTKQYYELGCYTYSLDCCMLALYQEVDLTHSDLFGNILKSNVSWIRTKLDGHLSPEELKGVKMKKYPVTDFCLLELEPPARVRPKQRRRGYNDHGSGQPNHKSGLGQYSEDIELELLQERIELRRAQFSLQWRNRIHQVLSEGCS